MEDHREKSRTATREEQILESWRKNNTFQKTLLKPAPKGEFVFYDGPPFATGLPHHGHFLGSIAKDLFGRYKTMRGYHVRRRWGWDCHGLPIENMVEKELGIKDKKGIEKFGVAKFNEACRVAVLRYAGEWQKYIERIGRWVEYENSYKTMDNTFMESVWWMLKKVHNKKLLYEGRKVLLYCPHCETPLAKAEIAMDNSYKDVTEESVTIKFKVIDPKKHNLPENTHLLAWTTTPWTLPGNVALAVGSDIDYVAVEEDNSVYILAKELQEKVVGDVKIVSTHKGSELVGIEYEPLYEIDRVANGKQKAWYVTDADFVTTEDGTGIVHTAVVYGEDDYNLGVEKDLPMVPLLDGKGHFTSDAPKLVQGDYFKKSEGIIKDDLEKRGLLFAKEIYTHSYPHCHRCETPLLYNAITSWFINIQKVKKRLIKLNEKINWVPEHLKHGRFLHNLENAPDWTISRNRYWASPLPIWKCGTCSEWHVVGSVDELKKHVQTSGNTYFVARHGEAEHNLKGVIDGDINNNVSLTQKGEHEARRIGKRLKRKGIDIIITSPFKRSKETSALVAQEIGLAEKNIHTDKRIGEIDLGTFEGKTWKEYHEAYSLNDQFVDAPEGGETRTDVKKRVGDFLYDVEKTHKGKTILFVTHGIGIASMNMVVSAATLEESLDLEKEAQSVATGKVAPLSFVPLPHNADYELDLHRPYIDAIELACSCGGTMKRIPEVIDGWAESGSMPFAEYHYPFENKRIFKKRSPGDYVAEYIAQTRTWFYYMHAVSTILFKKPAFKNVVTTGTILARNGEKMSKSKRNFTDPLSNLDTYGADALRYYLMTSVVMQAEDLNFSDDELREAHNRVINILWNVTFFSKEYQASYDGVTDTHSSPYVLDQWIVARLHQLIEEVSDSYDAFNTITAGKSIRDFITDLSTWYIRRSRDRFKGDDEQDKQYALATTKYVLLELSKVIAPLLPFLAESVYRTVGGMQKSVHLEDWPEGGSVDEHVLSNMEEVRTIVSLALEARSSAKIKVRQPLARLTVRKPDSPIKEDEGLIALIAEEVNVKDVVFENTTGWDVELDTAMTPELKQEGQYRELVRHIQSLRKSLKLSPQETVMLSIEADEKGKKLIQKFSKDLKKVTKLKDIEIGNVAGGDEVDVGGLTFKLVLKL